MYEPPRSETPTRYAPLRIARIAIAVTGGLLVGIGRATGVLTLAWVGLGLFLASALVRIIAATPARRAMSKTLADAPMTPERQALHDQMKRFRVLQIGLLAAGTPLVVVASALHWDTDVATACAVAPLLGVVAWVHRRTLANRSYQLALGVAYQPMGSALVPGLAVGVALRVPLPDGSWVDGTVLQIDGYLIRLQAADGLQHWVDVRSLASAPR